MDSQSHFEIFRAEEKLRDAEIERRRAIRERTGVHAGEQSPRPRVRRARRPRHVRQFTPPRFA
jgi:hypothetical protein